MEKYAVDLDQVLNDFEYSELTDQQSSNRNGFSIAQIGPTKHSINNVFHSLNEYLNTSISRKNEAIQCETSEISETNDNLKSSVNSISDNIETKNCDNLDNQVALELVEESRDAPTKKTSDKTSNNNNSDVISGGDEKFDLDLQKNKKIDETELIINENKLESQSEIIDEIQLELESQTNQVDILDTKHSTPNCQSDETIENQVDDKPEQTSEIDSKNNLVGFDEEIDLDDTELHKYLDELEAEFENEQNIETEIEQTVTEVGCDCEKIQQDGVDIDDQNSQLDNIENNAEESASSGNSRPSDLPLGGVKREIDLIGDPGSTPYNNVYVNKELPESDTKHDNNSDTEYSTSASPTFSDISSETTSSCTPSTDTLNEPVNREATNSDEKPEVNDIENNIAEGAASADQPEIAEEVSDKAPDVDVSGNSLGKEAPLWIPDSEALNCLHCNTKFTVIKRRHHCRACGLVLCSKCCGLRHFLEYLDAEARVCNKCYDILTSTSDVAPKSTAQQPNPNNPLEYCSTIPPHQQVSSTSANPPAVMVPVGVLKRKGSNKSRSTKSVMFCDGIRPGSDLTNLDHDFGQNSMKVEKIPIVVNSSSPCINAGTSSFIPDGDGNLPPVVTICKNEISYSESANLSGLREILTDEVVAFSLQLNLIIRMKFVDMDCCINKKVWCFATEGLINVGQDEIVMLIECSDNPDDDLEIKSMMRDIFLHINSIYLDALKGTSVKEMGISLHFNSNFLKSKNHAGFVYIRPTFQCLQKIIKPDEPFLIGILIHRWETPWAKLFPLRLVLRLGAEYRYYPCPIVSTPHRDSVFVEIGHTIINLLADFRNFSYTLPQIRGLTIHMEDKNTTVAIPSNRYDQIIKSMSNSSDHILAFAGNFSVQADSHLVCIQDTQGNENSYATHAINIHNKPRKVTGASFIVFNGALKSTSGLTAKSSIVEDGLMIQIPSEHLIQIRDSLRNMKNHTIQCGCINAASDEAVNIIWVDPDVNFNLNVLSPIDSQPMAGIPSIRVHNGKDFICSSGSRLIRWTEVFILKNEESATRNQDPVDVSKISESIARAACAALVKYLGLLVSNSFRKIAIRTTLHVENVAYSAGSNGMKLPPIYMKSLDDELIPVLHRITSNNFAENAVVLELIFRVLNL